METHLVDLLLKDSPAPMVILDKQMKILNYSEEWLKVHDIKEETLIGKSIAHLEQLIPKALQEIIQECLLGNQDRNSGAKFILPNGNITWLSWKINPWRNADNEIIGLIMFLENVTARKRKEELLMKAKSVARIGGWEVDLISNKVYWTDITKEIHEMPEDYVPSLEEGINFYKAGEHRDKISLLVSDAIQNGTSWDTELVIVTSSGKELWVRAKGEAEMVDGKCVRLVGTFQDINEQKKADIRFKEVSQRLSIATNAAGIGIWEYNIPDNTLIWDDNMYKLYGVRKEDFAGVYEAWESTIHPSDKERSQKEVALAIKGEKDFNTEFRVLWPNGKVHTIKAEAVVQRDAQGSPLKMIGINWDISPIRNAEVQLKKLLNATREQNEGLTNFAHIVSHNLRSHATNIAMLTDYLIKSEDDPNPEDMERDEIFKMLGNAAESLNETVVHLNDVVQIRSDIREKIEKIAIYPALQGALKNIGKLIEDQKAVHHIRVDENLKILAVPAYLDSILLNLFTNSLKYAHPERRCEIHVSTLTTRENVILKFRDNGLGIDLKRHGEKLFGMYKTFHNHKEAKGIGLFITKNQIEAMGGRIEVDSVVGEWTEFNLYFKH
ncbi:PAS domain-containing protein [Maribacter sp. 2307UL18-2]|uniref:PAS domain-containing sensor histidine kinase n=1 Tax=Maribacter sp. 2307UL18-2 TaxID=3386274 RepID=UPI0039BD9206